ncbi:MAG: glycosyltransferase family 4 protein [Firmicutes bacterium]|nr:glycosyltransferase family 4 protein [Bacillota bacterium]
MRIIYLCHYFYPEIGAPPARVVEMASEWVKAGHQVTVVTGFPNHPTGVIPREYRGYIFKEESYLGIRVLRNWLLATPNEGVVKRTICHLSFMVSAVVLSLPRLGKNDVIIASSPTFFSAFAAWFISRVKRIPFVFEVRDLWPAAIAGLGVLRPGRVIRMLEKMELWLYRKAAKVVVVTRSFREDLIQRGVPEGKIEIVYNGVDYHKYGGLDQAAAKKQYGFEKKLVVLYAGALGLSHSLETLLEAARNLQARENVQFLLVGEGARKKFLIERAGELGLKNVAFWEGQPWARMPEIYALADICIVSLRGIALFDKFIPSKIFEILASRRPMVACLAGEAAKLVAGSGAARVVAPEDAAALTESLEELLDDADLRAKMGESGYQYVVKNFNRFELARQYTGILETVVKRKAKSKAYLKPQMNANERE